MAEEVKKKAPAKPRKPRAPKVVEPVPEETKSEEVVAEPSVLITKPEEEEPIATEESSPVILEPEEEEPVAVAELDSVVESVAEVEQPTPLDIPVTEPRAFDVETLEPKSEFFEDVDVRIQAASTELSEDAPTYEEFSSSLESSPVEIKKLNPNLPDSKSKWLVQIPYGKSSAHVLFKGSYVRALQAAQNYNIAKGLGPHVTKN